MSGSAVDHCSGLWRLVCLVRFGLPCWSDAWGDFLAGLGLSFSGFSEAEAGCGASRQPRNLPVACAPAPEKPLNAPPSLGDTPKQPVKAHSRPTRGQPVTAQLPYSALHGVLFAAPQIRLDPKGKLQDRQLRRVQEQDLREDRAFHDLVLVRGRKQAPPDIVVVHGKALLSCATPPAVSAARGHFA